MNYDDEIISCSQAVIVFHCENAVMTRIYKHPTY